MALPIETFSDWPIYYLSRNLLERLDATTGYIDQMLFSVQGWMTLGAILLSVIVGFRLMLGFGDFREALTNLFRIIFLTTVLSSGTYGYTQLIKPAIEGAQQFLAQTLDTDDRTASTPQQDAARKSPYGRLDSVHKNSADLLHPSWKIFKFIKPSTYPQLFLSFVCYVLSLFASLFLAFVLLGAEVILKILFVLGPIFIFLFLYQSTRNFTFLWISAVVSNLLLFAITSVFVMIVITILQAVTTQPINKNTILPIVAGMSLFMLLIIKLAAEIPALAGSLSGGTGAGSSAAGLVTAATAALGAGAMRLLRSAFSPPRRPHENDNGETRKPSRSPMGNLAHLGVSTVKKATALGASSATALANATGVADSMYHSPVGKGFRAAGAGLKAGGSAVTGSAKKIAGAPAALKSYNAEKAAARRNTSAGNTGSSSNQSTGNTGQKNTTTSPFPGKPERYDGPSAAMFANQKSGKK